MAAVALKAIALIATASSVSGCFQQMGTLTALNLLTMGMPRPGGEAVVASDSQPVASVTNTTYVSNTTYVTSGTSSGGSRSSGHGPTHRRRH